MAICTQGNHSPALIGWLPERMALLFGLYDFHSELDADERAAHRAGVDLS